MRNLFKFAVFLALLVGAAAYPTVKVMDNTMAKDVLVILRPHGELQVAQNRNIRSPDDPIAEIYGTPTSEKVRVVFYDQKKLLKPVEDQNLLYYLVHDETKDHPTQIKSLYFIADRATKLGLGFGILGTLIILFLWKPPE